MSRKRDNFLQVRYVDPEKRAKALFVLKCQGKNLSVAVREMIDKYAEEFDNMKK